MSFLDWVKEEKEKEKKQGYTSSAVSADKSNNSVGGSSFLEWAQKEKSGSSLYNWLKSANDLATEVEDRYKTWHGNEEEDEAFTNYSNRVSDLLSLASDWRNKYSDNKEAVDSINQAVSLLTDTRSYASGYHDYYSNFESEDDLNKYNAGWLTPTTEIDTDKVAARKDIYNGIKSRISEIDNLIDDGGLSKEEKEKLKDEKSKLEDEIRLYDRTQGKADSYSYIYNEDDFEKSSEGRDTYIPTREQLDNRDIRMDGSSWYYDANGNYYNAFGEEVAENDIYGIDSSNTVYLKDDKRIDRLGLYLSTDENERSESLGNAGIKGTWETVMSDGIHGNWEKLTEQEIDAYYYLLNTKGYDAADKFLDDMTPELNRRATEEYNTNLAEIFEDANPLEKVALNAATLATQPFGNIAAGMEDALSLLTGQDINPYSMAHGASNFSSQVRGLQAEEFDELTGGASLPLLDFSVGDAYQAGMSYLDSVVGTLIGSNLYGLSMGLGSFSDTATDLYLQGASLGEVASIGAIAGVAEGFFEKYSLDKLIKIGDSKTLGQFLLNVGKQAGIEASEEAATTITKIVADAIIRNGSSNWDKLVEESDGNVLVALGKEVQQVGKDALSGAISGALGGSTYTAKSNIASQIDTYKQGKNIIENNGYNDLKALALDVAKETSGTRLGDKVSKAAIKADTKTTAMNVGKLSNAVETVRESLNKADIQSSLEKQGMTKYQAKKAAEKIIEVAAKQAAGVQITDEDYKAITKDNATYEVYRSLISDPDSSVNSRDTRYDNARNGVTENEDGSVALSDDAKSRVTDKIIQKVALENITSQSRFKANTGAVEETSEADDSLDAMTADEAARYKGKTTYMNPETGEIKAVKIEGISSIKDGEMMLKLDSGETVNASDVRFSSEGEALVYSTMLDMGVSAGVAEALVNNFHSAGYNINGMAGEYALGIKDAYYYGKMNIPMSKLPKNSFAYGLSESQRDYVYKLGQNEASRETESGQKAIDSKVAEAKKKGEVKAKSGNIIIEEGVAVDEKTGEIDESSLTDVQKANLAGIKALASLSPINFHIFRSEKTDGKFVGKINGTETSANGVYFEGTNDIWIDLNAGDTGEGTMLWTAAHEVSHYIKERSLAKWKAMADFLIKEYSKKKDVSVSEMLDNQVAKVMKRSDAGTMSESKIMDLAHEELVSDALSDMLTDGSIVNALAEVKQQNKGLWNTIKAAVADLLKRWGEILGVYKGRTPDAAEARALQGMEKAYKKLQKMYTEAFIEANAVEEAQSYLRDNGIDIVADGKQEAASLNSVRNLLDNDQKKKVSKALADRFDVTEQEAMDWLNAETSLASLILNPKYAQHLDYEADSSEDAIKKNSDYPQGTVDFSNICKKRRAFTEVMGRVLRNFPNHVFMATDLAKVRSIMEQEGMEVACAICYVEDRRQLDSIIAKDFIDSLELYRKGSKTRPDGKPFNANQLKAMSLIEGDSYTPSVYELISLDGRNELKANNPNMEAAWVKFNNARGMQSVRLLLNEAEYTRQILKYNKKTVQSKNNHGGLRIYSFSDMEMFHLIDIIQVITDSASVGLMLQGYTKVNEYAKAVKDTGEKLNRSLIPKGDLGYHIEDGEIVLDFDTVEGIDISHKDFFDSTDNPDVGNIVIGINKKQIQAAMVSKFIDQIIPFHTGQSSEVLGEKGIATWQNYKDSQTEKDLATGTTAKHQINIYTEVIQAAEKEGKPITNKVEFVNKFLAVCKENGLEPRFSEFLNTDENGDYVYTEGYHKLLVDFKTFDQRTGEYLPQKPVKPVFDNGYITQLLKVYAKSQKQKDAELAKAMPKVIDRITKEIIKPEAELSESNATMKFSVRNVVEETQDLVAMHNITYELLQKAIERNGLIMPSLAVTNKEFNNFGEISLVFAKDTIDPNSNEANKLYGADAWTPTQTELKKNAKFDTNKTVRAVNKIKNRIGSKNVRALFDITPKQFMSAIVKADGSIYQAFAHNIGMQAAYALENGIIESIPKNKDGAADISALRKELERTLDTDDGWRQYKKWLNDISDTVITSYDSATAEDIFRNMMSQPSSAKTFKLSESGELTVPAAEYSSVDIARENKHRLSTEAAAETKQVANKLLSFAEKVSNVGNITISDCVNAINNAFAQRYDIKGIISTFAESGIDISSDEATELQSLYREAVELPTPYFEAKPQRTVGLNEIKAAIVPDNIPAEFKESLEGLGIQILEYKRGDNKERAKALNSVENVKFSERNSGTVEQKISSAKTSIKQIPALFTNKNVEFGETNIDIGGGKFDLATRFLAEKGTKNYIFDPYNRGEDVNRATLTFLQSGNKADTATCANVLNVIAEENARANVILEVAKAIKPDGTAYFMVYEGDSSGNGKETSAGWQNNRKTADYIVEISKYFEDVSRKGKLIIAKNPTANLPKAVWEIAPGKGIKYQERGTDSNRSLLAGALETTAQNDAERQKLAEYKEKISLIDSEQQKLSEINAEIKKLSFAKGKRNTEKLKSLRFEAVQIANRINTYDRQLLNLESTKVLKRVLDREKALAKKRQIQKNAEALAEYKEKAAVERKRLIEKNKASREKAAEGRHKTVMRHKITKVVSELNQLLLNGSKDNHVMIGLQKVVAEALDAVNMDTVGAKERIAKYDALIAKATDPDVIASLTQTRDRIQAMGDKMSDKLTSLKNAYAEIKNSTDPLIANSYDEVITSRIEYIAEKVGNTSLRDMSLGQLEDVYDMYKMVLTTIRNANKSFKAERSESIAVLGNNAMMEVEKVGGSKTHVLGGRLGTAVSTVKSFDFNNLKPVYAFERIGSKTLSQLYENVRKGEDVWAVDITEAKEFKEETAKKYGYDKWDFKKVYTFKSSTGREFSLSLEQIMSLYAYSKRDQALPHLAEGGFVFDQAIETYKERDGKKSILKYRVNTATAYKVSAAEVANIIGNLTDEQKDFVDEMQDYLSTVMGDKGNEVSLEMYGIKLFKEKHYFPLKSAKQYMFEQNEVAGEVKIKNSGFSKATVKNANNPVILSDFMDVWSNHVNDMSMYHAFVLPLEDFNRVFNYKTPASESLDQESVKSFIQNAYGREANQYISQLIKDLNGGARVDPRESIAKNLIGKFKKAAVFGSLSVIIQQPSAIARALALIDAKYFDYNPKIISHKKLWAEVKKYAPVAIIKEMGHFDTDMGMSTVDYISGKKSFMDKADDVLSKPAAYMDELTWVHIWTAVKREVKANNPSLKGEEYMQKCGERFTEIITKTQVYDSVLSRSANMRSKNVFMNMITSFMAEPTTSINMIEDAAVNIARGNKGKAGRQIVAVAASVVLNSLLVSLVYAARDDDEDETYLEKYIGSLSSELMDGLNPITYYPILKDIWSIMQGYDVQRSDMTLIDKAVSSLKSVISIMQKDTEDMDEDELKEHRISIADAWFGAAGDMASLADIPAKNIIRDIKAVVNVFKTAGRNQKTSGALLWDQVVDSAKSNIPIYGWLPGENKNDKLYDAIVKGDKAYVDRLKSGYKDEAAYNSAVAKSLRENDPRIREAAEARLKGDMTLYKQIALEIKREGHFSQDNIVSAINSEMNYLNRDGESSSEVKSKPMFTNSDYFRAAMSGDYGDVEAVKAYLIESGKTEKQIQSAFNTSVKNAYEEGDINSMEAVSLMAEYGGKTSEEASTSVKYLDFKADYPDYADSINEDKFAKYYEPITDYDNYSLDDMGISIGVYAEYCERSAACKGTDNDGDGKTDSGSKKAAIMQVIDELPLTSAQKDALYYFNGWSAKTLYEAPWF